MLAIIFSFFLPWVLVDADLLAPLTRAEQAGWGEAFGELRDRIRAETKSLRDQSGYEFRTEAKVQASGFEIPRLLNTSDADMALAFAQLFTDKVDGAQWKCYAVYAVPAVAMLLGFLYGFVREPHWGPWRKFPLLAL